MSISVMTAVWKQSAHKGTPLLLLLALADIADDEGGSIYPSIKTMAEKTRMSRRNTQYVLQQLLDTGELEIASVGGKGPRDPTQYQIRLDRLGQAKGAKIALLAKDAIQRQKRVQPVAPNSSYDPSLPLLLSTANFRTEWKHFLNHRKKMRKPMNDRAQELILNELSKRPDEAVAALQTAMTRGWISIKWDWIDNNKHTTNGTKTNQRTPTRSAARGHDALTGASAVASKY